MNEIYQLLQNVHEIVRANNLFLENIEQRLMSIEAKMTIEHNAEPTAAGEAQIVEE